MYTDFRAECKSEMDMIGSNLIMIKIGDITYCLTKEDITSNNILSNTIEDYIKKHKDVYIWYLSSEGDLEDSQKNILNKQLNIKDKASKQLKEICSNVLGGRYTEEKKYKDFIVKSDEGDDFKRELETYEELINPSLLSLVIPNFVLSNSEKCNRKEIIVLQKSGKNLYEFIKDHKNINDEIINSLILQSLVAYYYLILKKYIHKDFKPQNIVVEEEKRILDYSNIDLDFKLKINYIAKLIDFGRTDKNIRKVEIIRDLNRFFTLLKEVYKNYKIDESIKFVDSWKKSDQSNLDFLKDLMYFFYN